MKLRLNVPLLDWITATSYEHRFYLFWRNELDRRKQEKGGMKEGIKELKRYVGLSIPHGTGSLFIGSISQPLGNHFAMVAKGEAADLVRLSAYYSINHHGARFTRIDVQVTVVQPGDWSQLRFLNRCERAGKMTELAQSVDSIYGRMMTVYVNSRSSDRFVRVYQKGSDDGLLLRVEAQFGGGQAELLGRQLQTKKVKEGDTMRGIIQWIGDEKLTALIMPVLEGYTGELPKYARADTKTDKWLLEQVLPVLARRLNSHDAGETLRERFAQVIQDV